MPFMVPNASNSSIAAAGFDGCVVAKQIMGISKLRLQTRAARKPIAVLALTR